MPRQVNNQPHRTSGRLLQRKRNEPGASALRLMGICPEDVDFRLLPEFLADNRNLPASVGRLLHTGYTFGLILAYNDC